MSTTTSTNVNPRLRALTEAGVSVWLDQISNKLIAGGELARLVAEESLRGVTSNPAIFEHSILHGSDYDELIASKARQGLDADSIYDAIAVADVQGAADVLAGVHAESDGRDGFVSIEVPPTLARDTDATIAAARRYWKSVDRPNAMIKIRAPGGCWRDRAGDLRGHQRQRHAAVRGVCLRTDRRGLHPWPGAPARGGARARRELRRQLLCLACGHQRRQATRRARRTCRAAWHRCPGERARRLQRLQELFGGQRWEVLAAAGAAVQRPLWASTGVKNPDYPDTLYVDNLVAPHTVNTMPPATLAAVADHGTVPGPSAELDHVADLEALAQAGIDMDHVTDELLTDGIRLFQEAMAKLLDGIEQRRLGFLAGESSTKS